MGLGFADAEIPSGAINGINTSYVLMFVPNPPESILIESDSSALAPGIGFTLSGRNLSLTFPPVESIVVWYRFTTIEGTGQPDGLALTITENNPTGVVTNPLCRQSDTQTITITIVPPDIPNNQPPPPPPPPPPTATLVADPIIIFLGQSSKLTWRTTNATTAVIDVLGQVTLNGFNFVSPLQTTTYTLTATGPGGVATAQATVEVVTAIPVVGNGRFRSYITQQMQNYFDITDSRVRDNPFSVEVQVMNICANALEDLILRSGREGKQSLQEVPTNIDNNGVYYGSPIPNSLVLADGQTTFDQIVGIEGDNISTSIVRTLTPYVDTLPVPSRINVGNTLVMYAPIIFTLIGDGDSESETYATQYVYLSDLSIPNKLTFWVDQIGLNPISLRVTVMGDAYPEPAWIAERHKTTEIITITQQGIAVTRNRWSSIDSISVQGLPVDVRIRAWSMPFGLPAAVDFQRPYTDPDDRNLLHTRYWQIDSANNRLNEMFMDEEFAGLELINTYTFDDPLIDVAVEPNTYGMYAVSQTKLYYIDRRELMPELTHTGLIVEPLYGLQLDHDLERSGVVEYVTLSGVPYSRANEEFQYRYLINGVNSILPDGSLGPIDRGWRRGAPKPVSIPLVVPGDYTFRLECQDNSGVLSYDILVYRSQVVVPKKVIDISSIVDNVQGLAFDSYGKLWIWTGTYAVPIDILYDGYVLDPSTRILYTTDPYDTVVIE